MIFRDATVGADFAAMARMRIGFGLPIGAQWVTSDALALVAGRAEALGYDSLWVSQRILYPLAPRDEHYAAPGPAWPDAFKSALDPVVVLSFLAGVTRSIRLGTSVLVMPFFTPILRSSWQSNWPRSTSSRGGD